MRRGWLIFWLSAAGVMGFSLGRQLPAVSRTGAASATLVSERDKAGMPLDLESKRALPENLSDSVLAEDWNWYGRIRSADAESVAALVGEIKTIPDDGMRVEMRHLTMERWLELDPDAALAWASAKARGNYFDSLFAEWAALDRDGAIAAAESLADEKLRKSAYHEICKTLAAGEDPEAFLTWANELSQKLVPQGLYQVAITKLAKEDLETARRVAESIKGNPANMNSLRHVAGVWAESDPAAAIAWAKGFKNSDFTDQAMAMILRKIAADDPDFAGREFLKLQNPRMKREPIVRDIVGSLTQVDPKLGVQWLGDFVSGPDHWEYYDHIATTALADSPAATIEAMIAISGSLPDNPSFAENWQPDLHDTRRDPAELLGALDAMSGNGIEQSQLRRGLVGVWGRRDFEQAWAYASSFPDPNQREGLMRLALESPSDKAAAWEAAASLPYSSSLKAEVQNNLIGEKANENLDLALSRFNELPAEHQRVGTAFQLTHQLAGRNIRKAAEFAENLAPGPARESAWSRVIESWADQDPIGLSEWADDLEPGQQRDRAAKTLSQSLGAEDPEAAFAWAASISHEAERSTRIGLVIREWRKNNPAQAEAVLRNSSAISDAERQAFLQMIRQR